MRRKLTPEEMSEKLDDVIERIDALPMTLRDFCKKAGIDRSTLENWRYGHFKPFQRTLLKVEKKLTEIEADLQE
jgi:transcriptional regulator with XRE-family HTH domain